jgi:FkbM family methyltransferase
MYFPLGDAQRLGVYERRVQQLLVAQVQVGDVVWDVGANWGYFTLLASRLTGPRGRVFAFEPLPYNLAVLRDVVDGNRLANVEVVDVAVSDRDGTASLAWAPGEYATPSLARSGGELITVATSCADSLASRLRRPALVKVDVEGAEVLVLEGAGALLRSEVKPRWIVEVHSAEKEAAVRARFSADGYQVETICRANEQHTHPRHLLALPRRDR